MKSIAGLAASNGIAIAKALRIEDTALPIEKKAVTNTDKEIKRFESAIFAAEDELKEIKKQTQLKLGSDTSAIFTAHLLVLKDPEFIGPIKEKIGRGLNAEFALQETTNRFIAMFDALDNEYIRARTADIRDVAKRVLTHLVGLTLPDLSLISEEVIVIANDLSPSETALLNLDFVKGFVTNRGSRTSHTAILARTLEIPAVIGTNTATSTIENGQVVIVDGIEGRVYVNPSEEIISAYRAKSADLEANKVEMTKYLNKPTVTLDGHRVELAANIGTPEDVKGAIENGSEGIGLYRTEFLYMGRDSFPSEEEQYEAYKSVLDCMKNRPTVIRTLDCGGDKELPYFKLPDEMNPYLGLRAIRLSLEMQDMFRTQLRALLRASVHGNLKIMFPMIATLDEFRKAKAILIQEKEQLISKGIAVSESIEIGMMVEVPSAAVIAGHFAKEADFLSIGTNDLIQYTLAADRMNERVSYLYQPYHPAILRLVKNVIDAAHQQGKWVGMCGQMAEDDIAIPILLALGLDEFSMSASSILKARSRISQLSKSKWEGHLSHIMSLSTAEEVEHFMKEIIGKRN